MEKVSTMELVYLVVSELAIWYGRRCRVPRSGQRKSSALTEMPLVLLGAGLDNTDLWISKVSVAWFGIKHSSGRPVSDFSYGTIQGIVPKAIQRQAE